MEVVRKRVNDWPKARLQNEGLAVFDLAMQPEGFLFKYGPRHTAMKSCESVTGFRVEIAHGAVTRRLPISLDMITPRTEGYACDVGVWDLSIIQYSPFSITKCQPYLTIRNFSIAVRYQHVCCDPLP
jgi:hypothetical protein